MNFIANVSKVYHLSGFLQISLSLSRRTSKIARIIASMIRYGVTLIAAYRIRGRTVMVKQQVIPLDILTKSFPKGVPFTILERYFACAPA